MGAVGPPERNASSAIEISSLLLVDEDGGVATPESWAGVGGDRPSPAAGSGATAAAGSWQVDQGQGSRCEEVRAVPLQRLQGCFHAVREGKRSQEVQLGNRSHQGCVARGLASRIAFRKDAACSA